MSSATLVVDIGSSSVGAALVTFSKGATPKITFETRLPVVMPNESGQPRSLASVVEVLELVLKSASAERVKVQGTHIIFSSPWYRSFVKTLRIDSEYQKLVTKHIVEDLVKEAEKNIVEQSKTEEIVERRIISTKLNGYETAKPYNKRAKNVELTFFASVVSKDFLKAVQSTIDKHFHLRNHQVSSFSLSAFRTISGIMPNERDYIMVDVRGEVTDVTFVSNGVLVKSVYFSRGKDDLVRAVSEISKQTPEASLSLLAIALRGDTDAKTKADVDKFTEIFKKMWQESLVEAVKEVTAGTAIPQTIFLMASDDIEKLFANVLSEMRDCGNLHLLKNLNVRNFVETNSVLADPFLALESIFVTMV